MEIRIKNYARRSLPFSDEDKSGISGWVFQNEHVKFPAALGVNAHNSVTRIRLRVRPVIIDELYPFLIVVFFNLFPRQFLFHCQSLTCLFGKWIHRPTRGAPLQIKLRKRVVSKHLRLSDVPSKYVDTRMARLLLD